MSRKWTKELDDVAGALDPRLNLGNLRQPTLVCREKHDGTKFIRKPCNYARDISELLSVVLLARTWEPERLSQVLEGFSMYKDINIFLILNYDAPSPTQVNVSNIFTYDNRESDGRALNDVLAKVDTPFVLIGNRITYFSMNHTSLTRMIQVMDRQPSIAVVGGSYRNNYGEWRHGCLQRSITNFHATFIRGYEYSHQECMYCDDIIGPFVANTKVFSDIPFIEDLSEAVVYHDWFTRISRFGYLTMVCPDVMFFTEDERVLEKSNWKEYAKQWSVVSVSSYDSKYYKFSCTEALLNCNDLQKRISWFLIPPCCQDTIMRGVALVDKFAREKNVNYELHHGSLLGAVKLGGYLPWDFDQDIYYDCRDKVIWQSMNTFLRENKASCYLRLSNTHTQLVIQCRAFFIDMVCRKPLSRVSLPEIYRNISTWIDYGGHHIPVMANPGSAARDQGGPENLRHAQHWRVRNHPDPGAWRPCRNEKPFCLDRHPSDGNIGFFSPPLCLP